MKKNQSKNINPKHKTDILGIIEKKVQSFREITQKTILHVQKNNTSADNGFFPFFISPKSGNEKQHNNRYKKWCA
jgi:hypothetical protein